MKTHFPNCNNENKIKQQQYNSLTAIINIKSSWDKWICKKSSLTQQKQQQKNRDETNNNNKLFTTCWHNVDYASALIIFKCIWKHTIPIIHSTDLAILATFSFILVDSVRFRSTLLCVRMHCTLYIVQSAMLYVMEYAPKQIE